MPRFTFTIRNEGNVVDISEAELKDADEARRQAVLYAKEEMVEGIMGEVDRTGWMIAIRDEAGEAIASFRFADLLRKE
jgi:Domain of unknown function (DUF6894)